MHIVKQTPAELVLSQPELLRRCVPHIEDLLSLAKTNPSNHVAVNKLRFRNLEKPTDPHQRAATSLYYNKGTQFCFRIHHKKVYARFMGQQVSGFIELKDLLDDLSPEWWSSFCILNLSIFFDLSIFRDLDIACETFDYLALKAINLRCINFEIHEDFQNLPDDLVIEIIYKILEPFRSLKVKNVCFNMYTPGNVEGLLHWANEFEEKLDKEYPYMEDFWIVTQCSRTFSKRMDVQYLRNVPPSKLKVLKFRYDFGNGDRDPLNAMSLLRYFYKNGGMKNIKITQGFYDTFRLCLKDIHLQPIERYRLGLNSIFITNSNQGMFVLERIIRFWSANVGIAVPENKITVKDAIREMEVSYHYRMTKDEILKAIVHLKGYNNVTSFKIKNLCHKKILNSVILKLLVCMPKTLTKLSIGCGTMDLIDENKKLAKAYPDLKLLKLSYKTMTRNFYFFKKYFLPFKNLQVLILNCIEGQEFEFPDTIRMLVIRCAAAAKTNNREDYPDFYFCYCHKLRKPFKNVVISRQHKFPVVRTFHFMDVTDWGLYFQNGTKYQHYCQYDLF
uniref:F-box domain-containing protein n=1 Tax=Rhabditophanes sp. KR3021 TaxID=114890 RepID=A0AC35UER3_9BILA